MEEHSYDNNTLERYLSSEMSTLEKQRFEEVLRQSPALQEELALQQDIIKGIQLQGSQGMKQALQAVEQEMHTSSVVQEQPPSTLRSTEVPDPVPRRHASERPLLVWLAVAASVLSIVLLGYLLVRNGPADAQTLYAAYYEPYPNIINPAQRSGDATEPTAPEQAVRAYEAGQYQQAINLFDQSSVDASSDPGFVFYYALSYLGAEQPAPAILWLKQVAQQPAGSLFYEPARWYLALAYLDLDQPTKAEPYLTQLAASQGDYATEAQQLLENLE